MKTIKNEVHSENIVREMSPMTDEADLGEIIYRPPFFSFLKKSMRILHLLITFFFFYSLSIRYSFFQQFPWGIDIFPLIPYRSYIINSLSHRYINRT